MVLVVRYAWHGASFASANACSSTISYYIGQYCEVSRERTPLLNADQETKGDYRIKKMVRRLLVVESSQPSRLMDAILLLVRSELTLALTRNVHKWTAF